MPKVNKKDIKSNAWKYVYYFVFSPIFQFIFPLLLLVISTAILKFLPWFPASAPWFPHFLYFHPDSPHSHAESPLPHFHPIPHISTLILRISLISFSNSPFTDSLLSLYSLRIYFSKIDILVQKRTLPFLLLHNSRPQIIIYIIYNVVSVINKNHLPYSASSKIYITCEVWASNSEWLKCYISFTSKGGTTCPKLSFFS